MTVLYEMTSGTISSSLASRRSRTAMSAFRSLSHAAIAVLYDTYDRAQLSKDAAVEDRWNRL